VSGVKRLRPSGGQLSLIIGDPSILRVFEITGLDRVFPIYPARAEAIEQFASEGHPAPSASSVPPG
jgi:anti-anti-sigma regulatory factor